MGANAADTVAVTTADALFANHLAFLAAHRGDVRRTADSVRVDGAAPFLSSWTPRTCDAAPPRDAVAARLLPGTARCWAERLAALGYQPNERLSYRELQGLGVDAGAGVEIRPVQTEAEALAFAAVQSAGFLESGSECRDWWMRHFAAAAIANYRRSDQDFLVAWQEGKAASVLLAIDTRDVAGIYAVATRPECRRRGLSTALLVEARRRAAERGATRIILQAVAGSYAEGFYARLGFVERYVSEMWRVSSP